MNATEEKELSAVESAEQAMREAAAAGGTAGETEPEKESVDGEKRAPYLLCMHRQYLPQSDGGGGGKLPQDRRASDTRDIARACRDRRCADERGSASCADRCRNREHGG